MSIAILESKLNRLKISIQIQGNKIIIGKPKIDSLVFWSLIIAPISASILIFYLSINGGYISSKQIILILFLLGTSIFNFGRMGIKKSNNNAIKVLHNSTIKIGNNKKFDNQNTQEFIYELKEIRDDVYEGKLILKDIENKQHVILGFDDENEQFIMNDLKWLTDFFTDYIKL